MTVENNQGIAITTLCAAWLKNLALVFNQREANSKPIAPSTRDCSCRSEQFTGNSKKFSLVHCILLWLVRVITLVLGSRHSFESRSIGLNFVLGQKGKTLNKCVNHKKFGAQISNAKRSIPWTVSCTERLTDLSLTPLRAVHKYFPRSSSVVFRITNVPFSIFSNRGWSMDTGLKPEDSLLQSTRAGGVPDVTHVK